MPRRRAAPLTRAWECASRWAGLPISWLARLLREGAPLATGPPICLGFRTAAVRPSARHAAPGPSHATKLPGSPVVPMLHPAGRPRLRQQVRRDVPLVPPEDAGGARDVHAPRLRRRPPPARLLLVSARPGAGAGWLPGVAHCFEFRAGWIRWSSQAARCSDQAERAAWPACLRACLLPSPPADPRGPAALRSLFPPAASCA